jgi:hypothetical protein
MTRRVLLTVTALLALVLVSRVLAQPAPWQIALPLLSKEQPPTVAAINTRVVDIPAGVFLVGELENRTGAPAYNVKLTAAISAPTGAGATATGTAALSRILPGERVPFDLRLPWAPAVYTVTATWEATSATSWQALTTFNAAAGLNAAGRTIVEFRVRNDGPSAVRGVEIAVALRDAAGAIVDVTTASSTGSLALGAEELLALEMSYRVPDVVAVTVQVNGIPVAPPAPTPTRDPARCDAAYPTVCIPSPPPDLDCPQIAARNFRVLPPDPHNFDTDDDGIGCETT